MVTLVLLGVAVFVVVMAVLVVVALMVGSAVKKAKGKKPAVPSVSSPVGYLTPAQLEREELVARSADRTRKAHVAQYEAEMDAKLDALNKVKVSA